MTTTPPSTNVHLLSRNPIFTTAKTLWGYEIQTMAGLMESPTDPMLPPAATIAGDFVGLQGILGRNKRILSTYHPEQIRQRLPNLLPARASVMLLRPPFSTDKPLLAALESLVSDGHGLAVEYEPTSEVPPLLRDMATHVCVTLRGPITEALLPPWLRQDSTCIGREVCTTEDLLSLQELGVRLFQGRFFTKPEIIPGRKLSAHQNTRLRLMRDIEDPTRDLETLARSIQEDITLSYRLLTYLNAPAFGMMRRVESIRQAMTLLGWKNLRKWLHAVLLADLAPSEHQAELAHLALSRGRFLERMVTQYDYWAYDPDEMFLLGMFSLLDAILGVSMDEALAFLPLTDRQKDALRNTPGCEYGPLLALARGLEDGKEELLRPMISRLSLEKEDTLTLYRQSVSWAATILDIRPATGSAASNAEERT